MRRFIFSKYACAAVWLLAAAARAAAGDAGCPHCEGQVVWKDVVRHECQLVPGKKQIKKTVYEVKEVPFCLHKLPPLFGHHGQCCDECRECGCVRYKKVLVKKEVVCDEICTSKCVPVEYIERGPCRECCPTCPGYKVPASAPSTPDLADQELTSIPLPRRPVPNYLPLPGKKTTNINLRPVR